MSDYRKSDNPLSRPKRLFSKIKNAFEDNIRLKYISILSFFLVAITITFIEGFFVSGGNYVPDTKINDYQTLGNNYEVSLKNKQYNQEKNIFVGTFNVRTSGDDVSYPKLKFKIKTKSGQKNLNYKIYNIGNNSYVVILNNLQSNFKELLFVVSPKTERLEDENTGSIEKGQTADEINAFDMNNGKKGNSSDNSVNPQANIYITKKHLVNDPRLVERDKEYYWLRITDEQIESYKKNISDIKKINDKLKQQNLQTQNSIDNERKDLEYSSDSEREIKQRKIEGWQTDINTNKSSQKTNNSVIDDRSDRISLLKQKKLDIKNGSYKY